VWGHSSVRPVQPGLRWLLFMLRNSILCSVGALALVSCSPRDFLSRRLATDLISASDIFKTRQVYVVQTGVISNQSNISPESLVLQQHGWIAPTRATCPPGLVPPPCWDVSLTPSGVDTVRGLVPAEETIKPSFAIPVARREFVGVTGISQQGSTADVDFIWRWVPLNEIGAALYTTDLHYRSTVAFREYDDGWRVVQGPLHSGQTLDDALKNAEPVP